MYNFSNKEATRKHRRRLQKKLRSVGGLRRRRDSKHKRSFRKSMKSRGGGSQYNYTACAAGWLASNQSKNWYTTDDNKVGKELSKKLGLFLLNRVAQQEITYHIPMLGGGERDCMIGMLVVSDALRSAEHMNLQNLVVDIFSEHLVGFDLDGFPEQHCWLVKLCDKLRPRNLSELPSIIDHNSSTFLEDLHTYTGGAHIQIHNCGLYGKDERLGQAMKEIQTTLSNSHTKNHQILAGLMVETGADAQLAVTAPIRVDADTDTMSLQLLRQHVTQADKKYPLYYMEWNTAMDTNLWPSDQQPPYLQDKDITDVHWWPPLGKEWKNFTSRSTGDGLPWKCSECVSQSSSSRYISWYCQTYGSLQQAETGAVVQFEVLADNNIPTSDTTIDASVTSYAQLRPKYLIADIDLEKLTESPHTIHFDKIYSDALQSISPSPSITYSAYLGSLTHYRLTKNSLFATLSSQTRNDTSDGRGFKNRMLQQIRLAVYTYAVALNHLSKKGRQVRWGEPLFNDIPSIDVLTRITKGAQDIYDTYIKRSTSAFDRMYNASKMVHANFLMQYGATIYDLFWVFATKGITQSVPELIARYPRITTKDIYPYIYEGIYLINMVTEDHFNDPNTFTDIPDTIHGCIVQNSPDKVGWKPSLLSTAAAYYSLAKSVSVN